MSQTKINNKTPLKPDVISEDNVQITIEKSLSEKICISDESGYNNTVQNLVDSRKSNTNTICELNRRIEILREDNTSIEKELWTECEHEWERDWDVAFDDRCKYKCKTCQLWRNRYLYY